MYKKLGRCPTFWTSCCYRYTYKRTPPVPVQRYARVRVRPKSPISSRASAALKNAIYDVGSTIIIIIIIIYYDILKIVRPRSS